VNICILAAGAGGMYCGSCMRDNALAQTLMRLGHRVTLVPLYTPLKTEPQTASIDQVFYGGINVYLQHASKLFRKTPRLVDWLLDRKWLLNVAGKYGAAKPPEELSGLTLSILQGEDGPAAKELRRLLSFLKQEATPDVVSLPNLMFIGMARAVKEELGVPVVCELTGEDIFLDAMRPADRKKIQSLIRRQTPHVDAFVATSAFYAERMADYLNVPIERISVVYPGIPRNYFIDTPKPPRPPTIGYMARICPEKGLHRLIDAMILLKKKSGMEDVRLRVAGYVGKAHENWYAEQQQRAKAAGFEGRATFSGEVEREAKLELLDASDVLCVPTEYPEAKGIFILESLARGTPVVQPAHGSFPELIDRTGGGLLASPGDAAALADALADVLRDSSKRRELGERGRQAVRDAFTEEHMAENMLTIYRQLTAAPATPAALGASA
jgi:glycosyltransferase involved in cell wall biosynthesis